MSCGSQEKEHLGQRKLSENMLNSECFRMSKKSVQLKLNEQGRE